MHESKQKCLPGCWEVTPPWLMSFFLKQSSPSPSPLCSDAPSCFSAQSTVILSHLFYLLFTPWCFSQVTSPATEISQSTFAAHSKYNKHLYFPGIFFLYYFLHSIKTIAGFLSHSRDLLEIIAISHTYYILKNNKKVNRQRQSFWTLCGHRSQCEQDRNRFSGQRLTRGDHTL